MSEWVLVIRMLRGEVTTISREYRKVYEGIRGTHVARYIKTRSDGKVYLEDDVAIIAYDDVPTRSGTFCKRVAPPFAVEALDKAQLMLWQYGLDKTPRSVVE